MEESNDPAVDRVVAELDVYSCKTLWGQKTKVETS